MGGAVTPERMLEIEIRQLIDMAYRYGKVLEGQRGGQVHGEKRNEIPSREQGTERLAV